jgi:hypothetical protein
MNEVVRHYLFVQAFLYKIDLGVKTKKPLQIFPLSMSQYVYRKIYNFMKMYIHIIYKVHRKKAVSETFRFINIFGF